MHKFFCFYNPLTGHYEISNNRSIRNYALITAENTLIPRVQETIQKLYECIVLIKEKENDEKRLEILDETELLISNLYFSLFASPLELIEKKEGTEENIANCIALIDSLIKDINIPEYNRLCQIIKNNLESLK